METCGAEIFQIETMAIQIIISFVAAGALVGVVRRFNHAALSRSELLLWILLWGAAIVLVWNPNVTNFFADLLGVGRGADAIFYIAIVILFYAVFRLSGRLENIEHDLSELVKKIALKDLEK